MVDSYGNTSRKVTIMLYPFVNAFGEEYQKIVIPGKENKFSVIGNIVAVTPINSDNIFIVDVDIWNKLPWSGWKIKIDFQARSKDGIDYRAERWFFLNKEGNTIFRTFELPLPYKDK